MQARMMRRVTAPVVLVLATGMTVLAGGAGPAAAAKAPNPCKLLKASEVAKELDGANLVTVQGLFSEGLPPKFLDVQEHLVALAKLATKRV